MSRRACSSATIQELARYWATDYDWRRCEARLNALPHFMTEIDGLDIHFIHVRSQHEDALPLIVTHGWPGSVIEQLKIIDPLTDPTAHGGAASGRLPPGDPVAAGLRLLRPSRPDRLGPRPHRAGLGRADEAPRLHPIRVAGRRLGRGRQRRDGRTGTAGAARHSRQLPRHGPRVAKALQAATRRAGVPRGATTRVRQQTSLCDGGAPTSQAHAAADAVRPGGFTGRPGGLDARPRRRLGPARRAGHLGRARAHRHGHPAGDLTRDDVLDNITLYWLTGTGVSAARLYWENRPACTTPPHVSVPAGFTVFPGEIFRAPHSWSEKAYPTLVYFHEVDKAATSPRGNSRSSSPPRSGRLGRCAYRYWENKAATSRPGNSRGFF